MATAHDLGMEGSIALAEMLSCNKSLTELHLQRLNISEAGLREIARGMVKNTSMQTLWVWPPKDKKQRLRNLRKVETSNSRAQGKLRSR